MRVEAGIHLGPYEILSPLGAGGMGEVYRARDTRLGREVAVKVLPGEFAADPERLRRFEQEARAVAALSHPNVLAVYDVGTHEAIPYLVTELLEGESLRDRLMAGGLTVHKAVETAVQIAQGLSAAHEKGIVHRDLKPANVFVTRDGQVKILDFGLAKLERPEPSPESHAMTVDVEPRTESGAVLGTMGFTSPEQLRGERADARSDIFSFGCVLYEMLAGKSPFLKASGAETVTAIMSEDPAPLSGTGRAIAPALQEIVNRCLEKKPADRFSSAHDLALALRAFSGGSETPATAPVPVRALRMSRRRLAAAAAVAFLAVAAALIVRAPWTETGPALDSKRVVVAPFDNRTGDPSLDSFGALIAEAVTRAAALGGGTAVVPGAAFPTKDRDHASAAALRALAKESSAGLVVSGATYLAGDDLRIQAQLFDPANGKVIVTLEPVIGSRRAPSSLLEPLRQRVLGAVACMGDDAMLDVRLIHVPTLDAYKEFQHGWELLGADEPQARAHFTRASELDPDFMFARAFLGHLGKCEDQKKVVADLERRLERFTELERLWVRMARAYSENTFAQALQAIRDMEELIARRTGGRVSYTLHRRRGVNELDLNLPRRAAATFAAIPASWRPVHSGNNMQVRSLQALAHHFQGDYEAELRVAEEERRDFPDEQWCYMHKAMALAALGRLDELNRVVDEATSIKFRRGSVQSLMGMAAAELRSHGQREASIRMAERAIAWNRTVGCETCQVQFLASAERWAEAKRVADDLLAKRPNGIWSLGLVGSLAARLGDAAEARQIAEKLRDRKPDCDDAEATYYRAKIAAQLGDKREAIALLKDAFGRGYAFTNIIDNEWELEPLWGDPEFKEFVRPKG